MLDQDQLSVRVFIWIERRDHPSPQPLFGLVTLLVNKMHMQCFDCIVLLLEKAICSNLKLSRSMSRNLNYSSPILCIAS